MLCSYAIRAVEGVQRLKQVKQSREVGCVTSEEADTAGVNEVAVGWRLVWEEQQRQRVQPGTGAESWCDDFELSSQKVTESLSLYEQFDSVKSKRVKELF